MVATGGSRWRGATALHCMDMQLRAVQAMTVMLASAVLAGAAQADDDPFAMLRERDRSWTFELVTGPSLDALTAVTGAPHARCQVAEVSDDRVTHARIVCTPLTEAPAEVAAVLTQRFTLVFDSAGVREAVDEDPARLAERSNAGAFSFPRKLIGPGSQSTKRPDGTKATVMVHDEPAVVRGTRTSQWISESTYVGPTRDRVVAAPVQAAAGFAPGIGPTLKCTVAREPSATRYTCLRLIDEPGAAVAKPKPKPAATVSIVGKIAHNKSSLSAAAVAGKITTSYLPAIRRCYSELLRKKPTVRGSLQLDFTVNAVGKLADPRAKTAEETLASCVAGAMASWRFAIPQSEYGEPRDARFVIDLRLAP